ncbi:hypothetical protein HYG87_10825 [Methanobacterium alkalithermotolerans]|uniref:Uncharacterized protein n=1 Tax=Methanobacterium alkalithermotolerans TaxID=2731220 RepID=A0A8T8K9E4_9EURY|nr:hypothetical protein [Methanobacterium alkalithermotolerans]QUH24215.1 hypothetical protein HYG87_10825 [Methanobacterium alkalithermotolerans]
MRDYNYFKRRYEKVENEFIDLIEYIEMNEDFDHCCYNIGSSKIMDFCLSVCTEIETMFVLMLECSRFDTVPDIDHKRKHQNIDVYREIIVREYNLTEYVLNVNFINVDIRPFEKFDEETPTWFKDYSNYKHYKLELIEKWNLKYALFALGCLRLLILNHPDLDNRSVDIRGIQNGKVFNLKNSQPRFVLNLYGPDSGEGMMVKL